MRDQFPRGKLCENDEGQLTLRICVKDKTVIIDFGKDLNWIGFDKQGAIEFAQTIIKRANEIKEKRHEISSKPSSCGRLSNNRR